VRKLKNSPVDSPIFVDEDFVDEKTALIPKVSGNPSPELRLIPKHFGSNTPVEDQLSPADGKISGNSSVSVDRGIDGHRSPNARRARATVQAVINSAPRNHHRKVDRAPRVTIKAQTIKSYFPDWLAHSDDNGQSPLTLESKKVAIEKFIWFLDREETVNCGEREVNDFLHHLRNGHMEPAGRYGARTKRSYVPLGKRTPQLYFVNIRTYFAWLVEEDVIDVSPLFGIKPPKADPPAIKPLSVEEVGLLLGAVRKCLNRLRNEAIIYLFFDTGLRVSELCSLRVCDIDMARRTATVVGKGDKQRTVWFYGDTATRLKNYLAKHPRANHEALFYSERPGAYGDGITPDGIRHQFKRLAEFAGIDPDRVSPHKLRHSFGTEFARDNGNIKALQMLMGHKDVKTTYTYVNFVEADGEEQQRKHSPARLLRGVRQHQKRTN
jgi:site-specific recombinase XerD